MKRRYLRSSLLFTGLLLCAFVVSSFFAQNAAAQELRPDGSIYIRARLGANSYGGDRDMNPDNNFDQFFEQQIGFPSLGLDIGYAKRFSIFNGGLALTYIGGKYERINEEFGTEPFTGPAGNTIPAIAEDESSDWRHTIGLVGRIGFAGGARISPYIQLGAGGTFGKITSETEAEAGDSGFELAFSPIAGLGLDIALTPRIGLFLEGTAIGATPDDKIDKHGGYEEEDEDFDLLGFYGGGLRFSLSEPFTPVEVVALDCPTSLETDESGTFTATINEGEATPPVESTFEFGDGTTATGLVATKSYNSAGTYTVTFTASNDGVTATESCTVEVEEPPQPATVVSINSNPNPSEVDEEVSFTSNVRGDRPVNCQWDFGDGETSTNCNPSHTYDEPGTYTVTLNASNDAGSDTASLTQTVEEAAELAPICTQVTEMNSAFFGRNSSTLSAEARSALRENVEILNQCPNLCARIEGYASRSERDPDGLSQDRADAVAEYYEDNGVEGDRLDTEGMGAQGQTTKKGGAAQFRRADTIPNECDAEMGGMDDDME